MIVLVMLLFFFGSVENTRGRGYSVNHGGYRYTVSNVLFLFESVGQVALKVLFVFLFGPVALDVLFIFLFDQMALAVL